MIPAGAYEGGRTLSVAVVGLGVVGSHVRDLFASSGGGPVIYDKYRGGGSKEEVNSCELAFVCVPTDQGDCGHADLSSVRDVLDWLDAPLIVLRSTVPVGCTRELSREYGKRLVFMPEFLGETPWSPKNPEATRVILGGEPEDTRAVLRVLKPVLGPDTAYFRVASEQAEMVKYMTNCFFAVKVTFVNEMARIAAAFDLDYDDLRELWVADPRVGRSHTLVMEEGGFSGRCLPKDLANLIAQAEAAGMDPTLLKQTRDLNAALRCDGLSADTEVQDFGTSVPDGLGTLAD